MQVSEVLFDILKGSTHHPTMDQLWERHYQKLLAIPDHVWRAEGELQRPCLQHSAGGHAAGMLLGTQALPNLDVRQGLVALHP